MTKNTSTRLEGMSAFESYVYQAFGAEGLFAAAKDFEYRKEQQTMALAVARALQVEAPLLVEAGTGVGKSLGYLLPAVKYAIEFDRKAVIATHTINLQEQLFHKDIPLLQQALGVEFAAALLKGRQNYLCHTRLRRALAQTDTLFTQAEAAELKRIQDWALRSTDGTLSDMNFSPSPKVWSMVCSEPHTCSMRNCGPNCPYQIARKQMMDAKVVVLNHTLFFGFMAQAEESGGDGFILPGDFVILDEAHMIENVAAQQLGVQLSESNITYELQRMFNQRTHKGILVPYNNGQLLQCVIEAQDATALFFQNAKDDLELNEGGKIRRIRQAEWAQDILSAPLTELAAQLKAEAAKHEDTPTLKDELIDLSERVEETRGSLKFLMELSANDHVYWAERVGTGGKFLNICSAPIEVGNILRERLFHAGRAAVLTSATLSTSTGDMKYFAGRIGAEHVRHIQIGSPFDYSRQMQLVLVQSMPDPDSEDFKEQLPEWIKRYLLVSQGRAFVLFTSYRLMHQMADKLRTFCQQQKWNLYVQGEGMQRSAMLEAFRNDTSSVLFGTDSFWTGVDVPGESLSNVIVTRLPFEVPDHPLTDSRIEAIKQRGGNAFYEYSLPVAILKLRQGVGRLIRTKKDTGMVVILDPRIHTKPYGKRFLNALPNATREIV